MEHTVGVPLRTGTAHSRDGSNLLKPTEGVPFLFMALIEETVCCSATYKTVSSS